MQNNKNKKALAGKFEVKRFGGRDIILVDKQPFYRSTGRNSGMAGAWLPFDGVGLYLGKFWFDKSQYCFGGYRYGNDDLKAISDELAKLEIPEGEPTRPEEINKWLGTEAALNWNDLFKEFKKGEGCYKDWAKGFEEQVEKYLNY